MPPKAVRPNNRLLVLCTSINDVTAWPFWKFLQMKKIKGVTDMALLAFNSEGGSFEARIDGDKYSMKNFAKVKGYKQEMFQSFLDRWYDPGRSYFVYGGHGMGDYLELEQYKLGLQAHELAALLDKKYFEAILFDACFMANLDCAYHLRHNTRYIGACEGYMWEPDTALDYHIFNTFTASAMSRFRDPRHILETIQREYTSKAPRGDFSVLDTTHVAELRAFVQEHVIQRVYNRATLYNPQQQERLSVCAEHALEASIAQFGQPGGDAYLDVLLTHKRPASCPASPDAFVLANSGRLTRRQRVAAAIQFEHSLYPSETLDKHLVDLKAYLTDMVAEEATGGPPKLTGRRRPVRKAAAGAWSPSRAYNVDAHGTLPPASSEFSTVTSSASATAVGCPDAGGPHELVSTHAKGSARYGMDLFNSVVLRHVPPRSEGIYASRLGGLSVAVHEYSAMSKPIEPWKVSKTILNKKVKAFLANGSLGEVTMRREFAAPPPTSATPVAAAALASEALLTSANPNSMATVDDTARMTITCHKQQATQPSPPPPPPSSLLSFPSGAASLAMGAVARVHLPAAPQAAATATGTSAISLTPAATRTASSQPSSLLASPSAYSSLSSRSRFYASYSCGSRSSSSSSLSTSPSTSLFSEASETEAAGRAAEVLSPVLRSFSADQVQEIQRMAMEAAQLLDRTTTRW